jgi:hypothetical protein
VTVHVVNDRQQGATVERSVVLTGGWQTSKETAYVEATRARHGTDWFIARDDLGTEGQDAGLITRLAKQMCNSRAHTPSLSLGERPYPGWTPSYEALLLHPRPSPTRLLTHTLHRNRADRDVSRGR